jgi:hypothetical protein
MACLSVFVVPFPSGVIGQQGMTLRVACLSPEKKESKHVPSDEYRGFRSDRFYI